MRYFFFPSFHLCFSNHKHLSPSTVSEDAFISLLSGLHSYDSLWLPLHRLYSYEISSANTDITSASIQTSWPASLSQRGFFSTKGHPICCTDPDPVPSTLLASAAPLCPSACSVPPVEPHLELPWVAAGQCSAGHVLSQPHCPMHPVWDCRACSASSPPHRKTRKLAG